jgi:hypothetical protein
MPIEQRQKFLGHSKLATTQVYAESSPEMLRESYQRALSRCAYLPAYLSASHLYESVGRVIPSTMQYELPPPGSLERAPWGLSMIRTENWDKL